MRPLASIAVADVITAIDGPIAMTACVEGSGSACEASCTCPVRGRWDAVNDAVREALTAITLADMAPPRSHAVRPSAAAPSLSFPAE